MLLQSKGLLFDYGGTLDSNGTHWASVLWNIYSIADVDVPHADFLNAYISAERKLGIEDIIQPEFNFNDVLLKKVALQFDYLASCGIDLDPSKITTIAQEGYSYAKGHVRAAKKTLDILFSHVPMVLVSNFYGNLPTVLEDFGIKGYFEAIVESATVGVRKPDPLIYRLGVDHLNLQPSKCLVVGDSYRKDIIPAKALGCQTMWLIGDIQRDGLEQNDASAADHVITDLSVLTSLALKTNK